MEQEIRWCLVLEKKSERRQAAKIVRVDAGRSGDENDEFRGAAADAVCELVSSADVYSSASASATPIWSVTIMFRSAGPLVCLGATSWVDDCILCMPNV